MAGRRKKYYNMAVSWKGENFRFIICWVTSDKTDPKSGPESSLEKLLSFLKNLRIDQWILIRTFAFLARGIFATGGGVEQSKSSHTLVRHGLRYM